MLVPSLSWQMLGFSSKTAQKRTFSYLILLAERHNIAHKQHVLSASHSHDAGVAAMISSGLRPSRQLSRLSLSAVELLLLLLLLEKLAHLLF